MIEQLLQADRLLNVDQVEKAEAMYRVVSEHDPANAMAVVGLARCALARGEEGHAYELASRALQIDPEDDMARRMEARLAEIITVRGESVVRPASATDTRGREMRPMVTAAEPVAAAPPPQAESPLPPAAGTPSPGAPTPTPPAATSTRGFLARLLGR